MKKKNNKQRNELINGILTVNAVTNLPHYYAKRLYSALKKPGTDDLTLIRIILIRSELDMGCIKKEFENYYGATLKSYIQV